MVASPSATIVTYLLALTNFDAFALRGGNHKSGIIRGAPEEDLSTFYAYPAEIRRIIYTTNTVEAYHRQLRKVVKTKSPFPSPEAARKLLYLATVDITRKWTSPIRDWAKALNQLVIRFEDRLEF
jgi:putative transposase